ncbi:MAG TPA: ParB/RepB/Spo0J family partition protein [Candidatus Eremiobacteraceae bacterium]
MTIKRGLGRGLDVFFPGNRGENGAPPPGSLTMIAVDEIAPNAHQPRRAFDAAALDSLAQSIRANGVLSPIVVRPLSGGAAKYEIVAGERRWRAARSAGLRDMPAIVREVRDGASIELALLENLQREDLNAIEEAAGYRQLLDDHGFTQEILSERLGKSRPTIANALRLLSLPESVQAMVRDGRLSAGHGRSLAAMPHKLAEDFAKRAVREGLSVREIERLAAQAAPQRSKSKGADRKTGGTAAAGLSADMAEIENRLRFALATKVALAMGARGGTITVHFADDGELQRIVDRLCPEDQ